MPSIGHFVIVDRYRLNGTVRVRDPWGPRTIEMSFPQLLHAYDDLAGWCSHAYGTIP
jgi:hypothetical protein